MPILFPQRICACACACANAAARRAVISLTTSALTGALIWGAVLLTPANANTHTPGQPTDSASADSASIDSDRAPAAAAAAATSVAAVSQPKWDPYIELLGRMDDNGSLGQADIFVPLAQNLDSLLFFNLRGHGNFDGQSEFNIGLGYRHQFGHWILGGFGHFDQLNSDNGATYRQATFGLEALGEYWDLRINGYFPEDKRDDAATSGQVVIVGNNISVDVFADKALRGFDGEIGLQIAGHHPDSSTGSTLPSNDLRLYAGGYHFTGNDGVETITGTRFRAEWGFDNLPGFGEGSRFSVGLETQYDEPRGARTAGLLRLRLPLGTGGDDTGPAGGADSGLDRRMTTPIVRDLDIVVGRSETINVDALNPSGKAYKQYLEYESREDMETGTDTNSGSSDRQSSDEVILVNMMGGGDAANWDMTDFQTAGNGVSYTLAGSETPIGFINPFTGSRGKTSFVPDGVTPGLVFDSSSSSNTDSMFTLSAGDHINGWDLDGRWDQDAGTGYDNGLLLDEDGTYYVTNTKISGAGKAGIRVDGQDNTTSPVLFVWDSEFSENAGRLSDGTRLFNGYAGLTAYLGGTIIADRVSLHHNYGMGVQSRGGGATVHIRNSTASSNRFHGISASAGGTLYATHMQLVWNGQIGANVSGQLANKVPNTPLGLGNFSSYLHITDSIIAYNGDWGMVANVVIDELDDNNISNYVDLADFIRIGETAPTLIAERVQVYHNGVEDEYDGVANLGALVMISDSSIWGNGWAGVWTTGYNGHLTRKSKHSYDPNPRTILDNVTIYDHADHFGVESLGGQVTITNSNVFNNGSGSYLNQTGAIYDRCIRSGGYIDVDGVRQPDHEVIPIISGKCTAGDEIVLTFPTVLPFPDFPSPFLP